MFWLRPGCQYPSRGGLRVSPVRRTNQRRNVTARISNQRGFSRSNLHHMRRTARTWPESIGQQAVGQLPWGRIVVLMSKCATCFEPDFHVRHAVHNG
ncbi:DUF1016 N-terminal domain-containing protein [Streptomyces sp. NP-1717]|uniref:DUF1016 N-terminal domain-containing protein n=1 Tax=Streptomyces sp. NP-1717 TaxID=2704470 RepID=UPI0027E3F0F3|nr:DUF1016 N-terminal domain-containing protein [Streptomyces sp. NP-1717]